MGESHSRAHQSSSGPYVNTSPDVTQVLDQSHGQVFFRAFMLEEMQRMRDSLRQEIQAVREEMLAAQHACLNVTNQCFQRMESMSALERTVANFENGKSMANTQDHAILLPTNVENGENGKSMANTKDHASLPPTNAPNDWQLITSMLDLEVKETRKDMQENASAVSLELKTVKLDLKAHRAELDALQNLRLNIHELRDEVAAHQGQAQTSTSAPVPTSEPLHVHNSQDAVFSSSTENARHAPAPTSVVVVNPDTTEEDSKKAKGFTDDPFQEQLQCFYELEDGVWDYSILIGLPEIGLIQSLYIGLLVIFNVILQVLLSLIINDVFTTANITADDEMNMRNFRLYYGHSLALMNTYTNQPLIKAICAFDSGVYMSTPGAGILELIEDYLPRSEMRDQRAKPVTGFLLPHIGFIGEVLGGIALCLWLMTVVGGLTEIIRSTTAFYHLPHSRHTQIVRKSESHTMVSVSTLRRFTFSVVIFLKFCVLMLLGFAGTFYIIRTISLRDILLNCTALEIVLNIDESMAVFIPSSARIFLSSLEPLPRPPASQSGVVGMSVFKLAFVAVVLTAASWEMHAQSAILYGTREEICGGNLDFVAAIDEAGTVVAAKSPDATLAALAGQSYVYEAMLQLTQEPDTVEGYIGDTDMTEMCSSIIGGGWSLKGWVDLPLDEVVAYYNYDCTDMLPVADSSFEYAIQFARILREAVNIPDLSTCSEVAQFCLNDDLKGVRAREVCPVTCGCNHPGSRIVLSGSNGCAPTCADTDLYTNAMTSRECTDLGLDSPFWANFVEGLEGFMNSYADAYEEGIVKAIKENGCGVLNMEVSLWGSVWPNPCAEWTSMRVRSIIYGCPLSCDCKNNFRKGCLETCRPY